MISVKSNIRVEFVDSFMDNKVRADLYGSFTSSSGEHISSLLTKEVKLNFLDKLTGKSLKDKMDKSLKIFKIKVESQRKYLEREINTINEIRNR